MSEKRARQWVARWLRRIAYRLAPIRGYFGRWDGQYFDTLGRDQDVTLLIESDGTATGTTVTVNGKPVTNCTGVSFSITSAGVATATLDLDLVPIKFTGNLTAVDEWRAAMTAEGDTHE